MQQAFDAHPERLEARLFTDAERAVLPGASASAAQHFAARFAAKEALLKALRVPGVCAGTSSRSSNDGGGAPSFRLSGNAAAAATKQGVRTLHLSITHADDARHGVRRSRGLTVSLLVTAARDARARSRDHRLDRRARRRAHGVGRARRRRRHRAPLRRARTPASSSSAAPATTAATASSSRATSPTAAPTCIVALVGERDKIKGDAKTHFDACAKSNVRVFEADKAPLHRNDIVVDAIFGTGLQRAVGAGPARDAIARMRAHRGPVVAVDVPSGLDADRGIIGPCVRADHTVTFAFAKLGLVGAEEQAVVGALHVVDIGIPERLARERGVKAELLEDAVLAPLRARAAVGHKGTHGHVLVVAGSRGKTGAALLCGTAVLRAGVGLVHRRHARRRRRGRRGARARAHDRGRRIDVQSLMAGKKAAAVGPGIARDDAARDRLRALGNSELPLVVDADALNAIAADSALLPRRGSPTVLTPHPGEAARLLGATVGAVQEDRVGAARAHRRQVRRGRRAQGRAHHHRRA